ncbi:MAG: CvpA family protein [Candidatus Omnitrophica bacterium]|nr:CvpA family protein [Candidatus Omnitrophota bacterium]
MNWVDVVLLGYMIRAAVLGWFRGMGAEVAAVVGLSVTSVVVYHYLPQVSKSIGRIPGLPEPVVQSLGFLALIGVAWLIWRILVWIWGAATKTRVESGLERGGGIVFGALRAWFAASLVLAWVALLPSPYLHRAVEKSSAFGPYCQDVSPRIHNAVVQLAKAVRGR